MSTVDISSRTRDYGCYSSRQQAESRRGAKYAKGRESNETASNGTVRNLPENGASGRIFFNDKITGVSVKKFGEQTAEESAAGEAAAPCAGIAGYRRAVAESAAGEAAAPCAGIAGYRRAVAESAAGEAAVPCAGIAGYRRAVAESAAGEAAAAAEGDRAAETVPESAGAETDAATKCVTGYAAEYAPAAGYAATDGRPPRDMSPEEYAHYIYGWISELSRRNYSRGNSVFIYISEEGFRAMQNDPEYEAWVMENIRDAYAFAGNRGGHDGYHSAHFFGATKEEYRGQSWSSGCSKCEQERRQELKRKRKKQLRALLKKRQEQKLLEKQRLEKLYLEKRRLEKSVYKKLLVKKTTERERLEEEHRKEALARREAASAFRMYMAILKYNQQ
ncbi:MAG: hypothetical protein NC123_13920 [Butyrivibrio sp.]|nr:hypothetical protein [Acetatifactor muris]MCM1560619.1 hypothetical protein [Butyrivibrio sp.]